MTFRELKETKMKTKKFLFYLLAGFLGGCVPVVSLHPLFTKENVVFEEKLLGVWVDDPNNPESTWEFRRSDKTDKPDEKAYRLIFSDKDGKKGSFYAHLVKLDNKLFLDACPSGPPWEESKEPDKMDWPYNVLLMVPGHTFIRVDSIEPVLKMRLTDDDKMKELFKEQPKAVAHEEIDDTLILTAQTKDLQTFVLKYADDERVFPNEIILKRKK